MIKAIVFDCFGVVLADNLQRMRARLAEKDPEAANEVMGLVALANKGILDPVETRPKLAKLFGLSLEEYVQEVTSGEGRNEELIAYIPGLKKHYKTAMLSNIGAGSLLRRFTQQELDSLFDEVVASGEIGYAKPEARAYEITAERLGVEPKECVFTDDREGFCEAARSVGMHAIVFEDFQQFSHDLQALLMQNPTEQA